jgi:hypothetical protein
MAFLNGRVSYLRFRVNGAAPASFTEEHTDRLADRMAGRQRLASADGIECGWTAGDHCLDTSFDLAKNIVHDALCFELAIDTDKLPADRMKAYYEVELKALSANNPSGFPSAKQKREAKESARERLEEEAKDGRFKKRKTIPVMWDRLSNEVLFGATSIAQVDRFTSLFEQTFQRNLECQTAGPKGFMLAEVTGSTRQVDEAAPSSFLHGGSVDMAWIADTTSRDWLGNEFLLWLWFVTDTDTDTLKLADDSEVTLMLARTLALECPRGQTGHETFSHEGPTRLPEARRAIQSGKLPRKVGITMVRHDQQYEFAIQAETLAVSGGKLPPMPEEVTDARAKLEARVDFIRSLDETLSLLFGAFLSVRLSAKWTDELAGMQRWLKRSELQREAA